MPPACCTPRALPAISPVTEGTHGEPAASPAGTGRRLLVTRPAPQAAAWVATLRASGIDAEALPLIAIAPPLDRQAVPAEWRRLAQRLLLVFVSPAAVERFFDVRPDGVPWPQQLTVAAPGPGTRGALLARGVPAASIIEPAADAAQLDSESLWQQLRQRSWHDASALVVRGDGGREWLAERLAAAGARVDFVGAYRREPVDLDPAARRLLLGALARPARHAWLLSSSESVGRLRPASDLSDAALRLQLGSATAVATHPRIAERAVEAGFGRVVVSHPTLPAVVACLQSMTAAESLST